MRLSVLFAVMAGLGVLAPAAGSLAQVFNYRGSVQPRYMGRPPTGGEGEDEAEPDEDMMMARHGRGQGEDAPPKPKTPLGKYIFTLDFSRSPETVLKARAKLAAQEREDAINPPDTKDDDQPDAAPAGEDGGEEVGGMAGGDDADAMRAMMAAAMRRAGVEPPAGPDDAAPGDEQSAKPGADKPKAKKLTKGERKAADKFRLLVVAGYWPQVKEFLIQKTGEDAGAIYQQILTRLAGDSAIVPDEILAVADASPADLTDKQITELGQILKAAVARGADAGHVGLLLTRGTRHFGGKEAVGRQRAASLLMAAGLPVEAQPFLDPLEQARKDQNAKLLNLHAMYFQGLAARKTDQVEKSATIKKCWDLCLEVLALEKAPATERTAAIGRALNFLDDLPEETGDAWLRGIFENSPDLGWALVEKANQKARNAKAQMRQVDDRVKALKRLKRIGLAIVDGAGPKLPLYAKALDMMALSVVDELEFTKQMQQMPQNGRDNERIQVVPSEQISDCLPTAAWLRAGDPGLAARLELMTAGVAGGSGDIDGVLEMVKPLVAVDKERAQKIADSVIAAWPNYVGGGRGMDDEYGGYGGYNPYGGGMYRSYGRRYYGGYNPYGGGGGGYDGGIPLTRAKQKRFLEQLGTLLTEFKRAGLKSPSQTALVAAFSASHSEAEVFSLADIEAVFGAVASMPAPVGIELSDTMRKRLGSIWRNAKVQQDNGTKRNDRQIAAEVTRGYDLASELAGAALKADAGSWRAELLNADLAFDKAEFLYGQKVDLATYSGLREQSFSGYNRAANLYVQDLRSGKTQPTAIVYFHWVSSALGASDLGFLTRQDKPDEDQVDKAIAALGRLPDAMREKHIGLFAKEATNALQTLAPELKVRFLTNACRVIGDNPEGAQARKTLAYYNDLKTEVELALTLDGGTNVGTQPFGASLAVWATRAVSRESGGFGKYTQNQQYNPFTGQPIDYKDELEKKLREALGERFEIISITFHKPGVPPMGAPREGWAQHPLAYLLLKAKDVSVDRVPAIKMDLDFSDGRGYVMMPVTTTVQLIDARGQSVLPKPENLEIEQVLDGRAIDQNLLKLDIKATAAGMIPALDDLLDTQTIARAGLKVSKTDEHGLSVVDLDTSSDTVIPKCERSWTLELAAASNTPVKSFTFPTLRTGLPQSTKLANKRYTDADIAACEPVVTVYVSSPRTATWVWWAVAGTVMVVLGLLAFLLLGRKKNTSASAAPAFTTPAQVTPVNAIATLQRIAAAPAVSLADNERRELVSAIQEIELKYFGPANPHTNGDGKVDDSALRPLVDRWVGLAVGRLGRV